MHKSTARELNFTDLKRKKRKDPIISNALAFFFSSSSFPNALLPLRVLASFVPDEKQERFMNLKDYFVYLLVGTTTAKGWGVMQHDITVVDHVELKNYTVVATAGS